MCHSFISLLKYCITQLAHHIIAGGRNIKWGWGKEAKNMEENSISLSAKCLLKWLAMNVALVYGF